MTHLELDGVTKRFQTPEGEVTAVDEVDLAVDEGEFLVLVGPSGCGKTTTLRMIAGLETPDEGVVRIGGTDVTELQPNDRDIAMVFQNYALYPHMTVEDNIGYGLRKSTALSDTEIQAQITEIAELMGIGDHLSKKPGQLSGGQKQRVATGRALVRDPAVFLLDEPLSNLDAELRLHMRTEIQRIQSEFGTTTVYVTHDQEEAMTMGDRIAVMRDGQIEQIGRPSDIYDHPRTQFVARFVGNPSMNFFQGRLADGLVETPAFAVDISDLPDRPASREYIVGVRPEAIDIASGRSGGSATVTVVEPTGSEAIVYLEVDDTELTVKTARENAPEPEDHVAVEVPAHGVYLFDSETGSTVLGGPQPSTVVRQ